MGLGYLSQEPSVFRKLTVEQNLAAVLETMPVSRAERRDRTERLLGELGLARVARQMAYTLSGGERRKLEISRALVRDPAVLMLDEPFSGVDPLAVNDIQQILVSLRTKGLGILVTDHNVRETLAVVDRAYVMYEGRVLREGASDFLINDPVSRELYLGEKFRM
jgi:lipopolysaccharide export system ATP-binding protein